MKVGDRFLTLPGGGKFVDGLIVIICGIRNGKIYYMYDTRTENGLTGIFDQKRADFEAFTAPITELVAILL